jgi:carbonic anhydrase/acetyltransferase-like protein (isoleucine patch superfamily)
MGAGKPTKIGSGVTLRATYEPIVIGEHVTIGSHCRIGHDCRISHSTWVAHHVVLTSTTIGESSSIGSGTTINRARIDDYVEVGARVIIRPTVHVPAYWLVPDGVIVNPNPLANVPVVIARTDLLPRA